MEVMEVLGGREAREVLGCREAQEVPGSRELQEVSGGQAVQVVSREVHRKWWPRGTLCPPCGCGGRGSNESLG
ncbi:unnamed protein product, partial [Iphiclides podalirius]